MIVVVECANGKCVIASEKARSIGRLPDLRSLAIFRACLGCLAVSQCPALYQMASVFGALGQHTASLSPEDGYIRSAALIAVFVSALIFALGFLTRLSNFLAFASLLVLQDGAPQVLQGGDVLLRLLLFWSLFLPLGHKWSLDAKIFQKRAGSSWSITAALAIWAMTLQICFLYWVAALLKSDPLWTKSGNALFYALSIEHFTTPIGLYLRQFPDLLRFISLAVPWVELFGPLLLFVPFRRDLWRMLAVTLFTAFHLVGMELLLRIGLFPWVCAAAWLIFIPGFFWDWIEGRIRSAPKNKATEPSKRKTKDLEVSAVSSLGDYAGSVFVAISFLDVVAWNIAAIETPSAFHWLESHDYYARVLRLDQHWNMYAPAPRSDHGWLVVPADLADGSQADLFTGRPVSWDKPRDIGAYFGDDRWRRFLSNLFDDRDSKALQGYADYLVRNWNQSHGDSEKVQAVTIIFMRQETQPDLTITPPEKDVLFFHAY